MSASPHDPGNAPAKKTKGSASGLNTTIIALGGLSLVSDVVGIAQWPQTSTVWITIVAGSVALLLGVPAIWIWKARRPAGWKTEVLFTLSVVISLFGAAILGGGVVGLHHSSTTIALPAAQQRSSGPSSPDPTGPDPTDAPNTDLVTPSSNAASPTPVSIGSSAAPPVRRQGNVTLSTGYQIDLDSTAPAWGVVAVSNFEDGPLQDDLQLKLDNLLAVQKAQLAQATDTSYQTCSSATGFGVTLRYDDENAAKEMFCMRTGDGHIAALRVIKVTRLSYDNYFDQVELAITVW